MTSCNSMLSASPLLANLGYSLKGTVVRDNKVNVFPLANTRQKSLMWKYFCALFYLTINIMQIFEDAKLEAYKSTTYSPASQTEKF